MDEQRFWMMATGVAALMVIVIGWAGGYTYRAFRERADGSENGEAQEQDERTAVQFGLPPRPCTFPLSEGAAARARDWRRTLHHPSIAHKNDYFELIGRCGVVLGVVFVQMALNLTILKSFDALNPIFVATDLFATLYVVVHWWQARLANQAWVLSRIHAELMRKWLHLTAALAWPEETIASSYPKAKHAIAASVLQPKSRLLQFLGLGLTSGELDNRIEACWARLVMDLRANSGPRDQAALARYLYARPIRQLRWYRMRHRQLSRAGHWRGAFATSIFIFTVLLASINFWLTFVSHQSSSNFNDWLNFGLLVATAISAAVTYWYVSRNERSISHRYVTQKREIESWLRRTATLIGRGEMMLTDDSIVEFETIMVSELIDWVHVTSHDVAELGG